MSCSYPPSSLCHEAQMCSQQCCCSDRITPVDLWVVPVGKIHRTLLHHCVLSSCSFCTVQNKPPVFKHLQSQNSRFGHSQETHLEEFTFIPLDTKTDLWYIYGISTEGDGIVTSQRASPSAFPGVSRHICSPETLLTLEQYFSLICHCFQWAFLKTKISYTQCKSTPWFQNKCMSEYQSWPCKYVLV